MPQVGLRWASTKALTATITMATTTMLATVRSVIPAVVSARRVIGPSYTSSRLNVPAGGRREALPPRGIARRARGFCGR